MPNFKKKSSFASRLGNLGMKGKLLMFVLVFSALGGSYYAYQSFAYTTATVVQTWTAADSELSLTGVSGTSFVGRVTDPGLGTSNKTAWGIVPVWSKDGATKADGKFQKQITIAAGSEKTFRLCAHVKANVLPYVQYSDNIYSTRIGWSGSQKPIASNQLLTSSYGYTAVCQTKTFSGPVNKLVTFDIEVNNRERAATNAYLWKVSLENLK